VVKKVMPDRLFELSPIRTAERFGAGFRHASLERRMTIWNALRIRLNLYGLFGSTILAIA
jgi:hypothetical protein